jgi:hypothetical protein
MAAFTYDPNGATWTPGGSASRITTQVNSDLRQGQASGNQLLYGLQGVLAALSGAEVPVTTATLSIGTTVTLASTASLIAIDGVIGSVAALTAQAFGSLGTIPTLKWGVIKVQRIANGTTSFVSGADNYSTGYDSEALAIAAMPATTASRVAIGYVTIYASHASGWVAGTDALTGGTGGNPAGTTNYYSFNGVADATNPNWVACLQTTNKAGTVVTSLVG